MREHSAVVDAPPFSYTLSRESGYQHSIGVAVKRASVAGARKRQALAAVIPAPLDHESLCCNGLRRPNHRLGHGEQFLAQSRAHVIGPVADDAFAEETGAVCGAGRAPAAGLAEVAGLEAGADVRLAGRQADKLKQFADFTFGI